MIVSSLRTTVLIPDNLCQGQIDRVMRKKLKDIGWELIGEIRANWSRMSPSLPGQPPAMRTGLLDRSLDFSIVHDAGAWYLSVYVQPAAFYAGFLEHGTYKMLARPFFRPAMTRFRRHLEQASAGKQSQAMGSIAYL